MHRVQEPPEATRTQTPTMLYRELAQEFARLVIRRRFVKAPAD
jgi:hypothetical protein